MTRVLIFEWVTGGGLAGRPLPPGWAAEGGAMRRAAAEEFRAAGAEVVVALDPRWPHDSPDTVVDGRDGDVTALARETRADYTLLIAPETGGVLERWTDRFAQAGLPTLGPPASAVAECGDKFVTSARLTAAGVATPPCARLDRSPPPATPFPYPVVIKPPDGAGSVDTYLVTRDGEWPILPDDPRGWLVQPWVAGLTMSASFLVGRDGSVGLLGVGWQRTAVAEGKINYLGGRLPAPDAQGLGEVARAVGAFRGLFGYVGVDFIHDPVTGATTVLELNPRLTTSFIALRRLYAPGTVARAWLDAAAGLSVAIGPGDRLPGLTPGGFAFLPDGLYEPLREAPHAD